MYIWMSVYKCIYIFILFYFIYLFIMAVLGLLCYVRALPSCSERGPLLAAVCRPLTTAASPVMARGLQARGPQQLWLTGSRAQAQQPWPSGPVAPRHVGSPRTRAQTLVPHIGRQIFNHCATREAPTSVYITIYDIFWHKEKCNTLKHDFITYILHICLQSALGIRTLQMKFEILLLTRICCGSFQPKLLYFYYMCKHS